MAKSSRDAAHEHLEGTLREAAKDAQQEGRGLASEAKAYAESVAQERKNDAVDFLLSLSVAVLGAGRILERQGYRSSADLVGRAAKQVGGLADQLSDREPPELLQEVERFAKARPALFVSGALLAGLGAARFLKSSPQTHDSNQPEQSGPTVDDSERRAYARTSS